MKCRRYIFCFLFYALSLAAPLRSEDGRLRFDHLTMDDGMSHNFVSSILKDSRGFIWFGTPDGLNRFDGSEIKVYKHDPNDPESLPAFSAGVVFEDSRKRLWIGTGWVNSGFALFDRDREIFRKFLPNPNHINGNQSRCFLEDRQGRLWIGTDNGLAEMDPDKLTIQRHPLGADDLSGQARLTVYSIYEDGREQLWVGTGAGLARFDRRRGRYIRWPGLTNDLNVLSGAEISDFHEERDGALWIATKGGLHRLEPSTGRDIRYLPDPGDPDSISHARVSKLKPEGPNRLYVGTEGGGLNILDLRTRKFTRLRPDPEDATSLNSASIWSLMLDDQGILWIGTYDGGVNFISPLNQRFTHIRARRGELSDPHVSAVMEDHLGNLWIGTDGGGLNMVDPQTGRFQYYREHPKVWTIVEDDENNLWLGGWDLGVRMLDPETGGVTRFRHDANRATSLRNNNVWRILALSTGELLVLTAGGVDFFDRQERIFTRLTDRYPDAAIDVPFAAVEDRQGNIWITGNNVLYIDREKGRTIRFQSDPQNPASIPTGQVWTVFIDSVGNVWLGGEGGLTCVAAGTQSMRRYTTDDGLPNPTINNILEDETGSLWMTTSRGLTKFVDGTKRPDTPRFVSFDIHDGLQGYRFTRNANFRSTSGRMFFGGARGLNSFFPESIVQNLKPPPIVITGLKLFNVPVRLGGKDSPLTKPLHETDEITLPYRSMLTIEYAALNFLLPDKNRYEYMLEGSDTEWNEVGDQRSATYASLSPGTYSFRVRGSNNDGIMNQKGVTLKIRVTPPFYRAGWFFVIVGLLAISGVFVLVRLRLRAVEAHRRELEMLVEQRTAALQKEIAEHETAEQRLAGEVSERKRAEEAAREYADKLAGSNLELMDGQRALKEKQNALERENEERRRAEQNAGRERDLLHALMDNIPDLIYFKDTQSRFVRINAALARTLGVARVDEALGKSDLDFFPDAFARAAVQEEQELLRSGQPLLGKLERHERAGRWYLATKVPLRNAEGAITGLVGISRDITVHREAEEKLARNLAAFQEMVNAVAKGDLTRRGQEGEDTVGRIASSVNAMIAGFAGILTDVHDTAFSVSTASTEILAAATEIAKGAEFGSDRVHSTSSAVEEMAASMTQVSRNAESSAETARQVLEHVRQGDRAVDATCLGMTKIDEAVSQTAKKMRLLEQSSREIFKIIDLIEEIASQSRLLSLNAAIEAAHAGEAGRGFAVVAEEVRRLADRSTEATKNVSQRVEAIVRETDAALQAMENAMREVQSGSTLSAQARRNLTDISTLVKDSADLASQISDASGEQVSVTRTVAEAMQTIANVTTESAAGARETARAVQDLVQLAERLMSAVSRFRIDVTSSR
jgi:PAS domain S-box-containing protein